MAGLKTMVTDMAAVTISAGASPGSTQIRAALSAILTKMEDTGDAGRVDLPRKLWQDLNAARLTYLYEEAPDSTGNDLAALATKIGASTIPGGEYGAIAVRDALMTLLNGWESSGDAGRVNTARSSWQKLHDARRLYQAQRRGDPVGGLLSVEDEHASKHAKHEPAKHNEKHEHKHEPAKHEHNDSRKR